jgi:N-acetyl sugar amidotransferase
MKFCTRCLYPENHPLGIVFDSAGVCSGCKIHEEKDRIDWRERKDKLRGIVKDFKCGNGKNYDCIVPVSGARDSHFIVHLVKHELKLNPLLVSYNQLYNTKVGIRNLAYLRTKLNCDFIQQTVTPKTVKRITRCTLDKMGSMYWHILAGQTAYPVQLAVRLKIPLIVWGVHQGCDQVGMFSHLDEVEMTRKYRKEHDLMGTEAEDLLNEYSELRESDMIQFRYPHDKEIESVGLRGIYLSNYHRWDSKQQHESMIQKYDYESAEQRRTFDRYNDVDSFHYSGIHDYIKFLKYGYGKVTDHATREIRLKRLTREDGISLVEKYQYRKPVDLDIFLNWLGFSENEFWQTIDKHRDPSAWQVREDRWERVDCVEQPRDKEPIDFTKRDIKENCHFTLTPCKDVSSQENQYTIIGKGFVENHERSTHSSS